MGCSANKKKPEGGGRGKDRRNILLFRLWVHKVAENFNGIHPVLM
jgi:hypothetical protein